MNRPYPFHRFHTPKHDLKVSRCKDGALVFFFFFFRIKCLAVMRAVELDNCEC